MLAQTETGGFTIEIDNQVETFRDAWGYLQHHNTAATYQAYEWVCAAVNCLEESENVRIIHVRKGDEPLFILPLVAEKSEFPLRIRWIGNKHANIASGLFSRQFLEQPDEQILEDSIALLSGTVRSPAILDLKNQPLTLAGMPNPMLDVSCDEGPNPLFVMDLSIGFEELLKRVNGRRKRKLFRQQDRIATEMGGYELQIVREPDEIRDTLALFFELKAERLKSMGIKDVFASQEIQTMLLQQALTPAENGFEALRLYVLKVADEVRAIFGMGICGKRAHGQISAVRYDDFSNHSPGEMMMYLMVQDLINSGFEYFDLGIGEERYKRSWCKQQEPLYETIYPVSRSMIPYATIKRCETRLKKQVKSRPYLWSKVKKLRKIAAGS